MITPLYKNDFVSIIRKIKESIIKDDLMSSRFCNMDFYLEDLASQTY